MPHARVKLILKSSKKKYDAESAPKKNGNKNAPFPKIKNKKSRAAIPKFPNFSKSKSVAQTAKIRFKMPQISREVWCEISNFNFFDGDFL